MVVLCTLVRVAGLSLTAPLLALHGLRSPAWRTREGTLRLVIAGLLCWRPSSSSAELGVGGASGGRRKGGNTARERQVVDASKKVSATGGRGHGGAVAAAADTPEKVLRDVGLMLKDERPEVCTYVRARDSEKILAFSDRSSDTMIK